MAQYGLVGRGIGYSFSPTYFREKFVRLGLADHAYHLYDVADVALIPTLFRADPSLRGLNVTIPYKQAILPLLDELDAAAQAIGAVNTIRRLPDGRLRGYNTDAPAFADTVRAWYGGEATRPALILGTGGAAQAARWALRGLGLETMLASRTASEVTYESLAAAPHALDRFSLIVNCTPVGTFPQAEALPPLPVEQLGPGHWVYDMIYNPPQTRLLREAAARGGHTHNGLPMLHRQAELAWAIWTEGRG
jgi:shikimate dehydrogenase